MIDVLDEEFYHSYTDKCPICEGFCLEGLPGDETFMSKKKKTTKKRNVDKNTGSWAYP